MERLDGQNAVITGGVSGARIVEEADRPTAGSTSSSAAGIPSRSRLHKLQEDEWDRIIGVNLEGIYTVVKAAVPKRKQRGGARS